MLGHGRSLATDRVDRAHHDRTVQLAQRIPYIPVIGSGYRIVPADHIAVVVVGDRVTVETGESVSGSDDGAVISPVSYGIVAEHGAAIGRYRAAGIAPAER